MTLTVLRRKELEEIIGDAIIGGRSHLRRIGEAFAEIQDKRLYAPDYESFEDYAGDVWNFTPDRARAIASGWKMAEQAAKTTRAEDMPLYFHSWFTNVIEDVGRVVENLTPEQRSAAFTVAKAIGTVKARVLTEVIETHDAAPETLAGLSADEQTERLRQVNADASKRFGDLQAEEFVDGLRRRLKKSATELARDETIAQYLPEGVKSGLLSLLALCSPSE